MNSIEFCTRRFGVLAALVTLTIGCGDTFPTAVDEDVAVVDDVKNDIAGGDTTDPDSGGGDATGQDTGGDGVTGDVSTDTAGDTTTADGGDTLDDVSGDTTGGDTSGDATDGGDTGPTCPGKTGCSCDKDDECDSKACLLDMDGKKACAAPCTETKDCADGDVCQDVSGVKVCVPGGAALCTPCVDNKACGYGDDKGACVDGGAAGSFCGTSCAADADCDKGYSCKDVKDIEGNDVKQCVPENAGQCTCTGYGLAKQAKTQCFADGLPGCTATVQCLPDGATGAPKGGGLTACTPQKPGAETCDGLDNDCDGQTDEDGAASCDDKNSCTTDTCAGGKGCEHTKLDKVKCDDGNACTKDDTCAVGLCEGATVTCDDSNPCTDDACDMATGCTTTNNTDKCDDGNACTKDDACGLGLCGGVTVTCDDSNPCTDDACDMATGCTTTNNTEKCDDSSACSKDDTCAAGLCSGVTITCDDGNTCTTDSCDPKKGCVNDTLKDGASCDDGTACTKDDACASGKCAGAKVDCDDNNPCTDDACDMTSGCTNTNNTKVCDDGSACSEKDACVDGACKGAAKVCQDDNACTDDSCDPKTGCVFANNTKTCDDNAACTVGDACAGGKCAGTPKKCDDGNGCTADSCDVKTGTCLFKPLVGDKCDDGNACTTKDACDKDGKCAGGEKLKCEDGNQCTDDPCDPAKGCAPKINTKKPCNDASVCTKDDTCDGKGACVGKAITCDDGNVCTVNTCDKAKGCQTANNSAKCDDGDTCTADDVCKGGKCTPGKNTCQCKGDADCKGQGTNKCNGDLVCKSNKCVVDPAKVVKCKDDGNSCTLDACNPKTGKCEYNAVKDATPCDADGSKCTDADACKAGKCEAGKPLNCDDSKPCTADTCDKAKGCINTVLKTGGTTVVTFDTYPGKDNKLGTKDDLKVNKDDAVTNQFAGMGMTFGLVGGGAPRIHISGSIVKPYAPNVLRPVDPKDKVEAKNYKDIWIKLAQPAMRAKVMVLDVHTNEASALKAYNIKGELIGEAKHPGAAGGNIIPLEVKVDGKKGWISRVVIDLTQSTGSAAGPELYDNIEFEWVPSCSDDNICTEPDVCDMSKGACISGSVKVCNDGNQCTKDACDAKKGCTHVALDKAPCEDGNQCTDGDACIKDKCTPGKLKGCDDGKPCTTDSCNPKLGCLNLDKKDGAPCEDGNKCTKGDACKSNKCVPGGALTCNDGDLCTADSCDPKAGCKFTPIPGCGTKPLALPYVEPFACGSASGKLWKVTAPVQKSAWAIDATPATPAPFSGKCSLNFNNGKDYACTGSAGVSGNATSPAIDLSKAKLPVLTFQLGGAWETNSNWDEMYLQVSTNGTTFTTIGDYNPAGSNKWAKKTVDLSKYTGGSLWLRFRFVTADCISNSTAGAFVDDVMVEDTACKVNTDCSDANSCTVDLCNTSTGKCTNSSVKNGTKCDDGNLCTLSACQSGACKPTSTLQCKDDGNACTQGEACNPKTGKCEASYIETCNDMNPCTTDTCSKATGGCSHASVKTCAAKCKDNNDCFDSNPCTVDTCGKNGMCSWTPAPAGVACGEGKACNKSGQCVSPTTGWARDVEGSAYGYHFCALTSDAKVACWGRNNYYQTGFATSTSNRTTPYVVPGLSGVSQVATGRYHSCALIKGVAYCWGKNNYRQASDAFGSTKNKPSKVTFPAPVKKLALGYDFTCALLTDGRVACRGYNLYGQLGQGNTTSQSTSKLVLARLASGKNAILTGANDIEADYYHACVTRSDGGLWCAGNNGDRQTHQTSGSKNVFTRREGKSLPALRWTKTGLYTTCAGRNGGWGCVGNSSYGAMGNGTTTDAIEPVLVLDGKQSVAGMGTGYYAHYALTSTGAIWGSGRDSYGQMGSGTSATTRTKWIKSGFPMSIDVDSAYQTACAMTAAGTVMCSGYGGYGQLGSGSSSSTTKPVLVAGPCTTAKVCNDGDPCTADSCIGGKCSYKASSGAKCDDGQPCTSGDVCSAGKCAGKPVVCDDKNACTLGDSCQAKDGKPVCVPGVAKKCDDSDKCTADSCDAATGKCVFKPIAGCQQACKGDADCDDGNPCTQNSCVKSVCTKKNVGEGNLCAPGKTCSAGVCGGSGKGWAARIDAHVYSFHACAIGTDTQLYCWGSSSDYRTGQASTATVLKPKAVPGIKGATDLSVGARHSCVQSGGKWWCFGNNFYGELGTGATSADQSKPQEVKVAAGAVDLDAGSDFGCAALASGKVTCWGYGSTGRLGYGSSSSASKPAGVTVLGVSDAVEVWAGLNHGCARLKSGGLRCWGSNGDRAFANTSTSTYYSSYAVTAAKGLTSLGGAVNNTCFVDNKAQGWCMGDNNYGQLGAKSPIDQGLPMALVGPKTAFQVVGGNGHIAVLDTAGKVWTGGYNSYGQLGINSTATQKTLEVAFIPAKGKPVEIASGYGFICALTDGGQVFCSGDGEGQGDGSLGNDSIFSAASGPCTQASDCADNNPCTKDACVSGQCSNAPTAGATCDDGQPCTNKDVCQSNGSCKGTTVVCDDKNACTVGDKCEVQSGKPVCVPGKKTVCNDGKDCTADSCDTASGKCVFKAIPGCQEKCKVNSDCDDGNPCTTDSCVSGACKAAPGNDGNVCAEGKVCGSGKCAAPGKGWASKISGADGGYHFCAVGTDGLAYCWGEGADGRLGDGSTADNTKPNKVSTIKDVVDVVAGNSHTCALTKDGKAWCWGNNTYGELGTGSSSIDRTTPQQVKVVTDAVKLGCGYRYTCALRKGGTVVCFGYGASGRLGYGSSSSSASAKTVSGVAGAVDLHVWNDHACAVLGNGSLRCWGENYDRQISNSSTSTFATAQSKASGVTWTDGSRDNVCWANKTATYCTGDNSDGQLGNGGTIDSGLPVKQGVGLPVDFAGGYDHNLAVANDGSVWAVGDNDNGQLGDGSKLDAKKWQKMKLPPGVKAMQAEGTVNGTCVLLTDGSVICVGDGAYGQLGTGSFSSTDQTSFQVVSGPCKADTDCNDGNACTANKCTSGSCTYPALNSGKCDDGNPCTVSDACSAGKCGGKPAICDDKNGCTVGDKCEVQSGKAVCVSGAPKSCDDGNPCTADSCIKSTGQCAFLPIPGCAIKCKSDNDCAYADSCTIGKCNTLTGACSAQSAKDGTICAEGGVCTKGKCGAVSGGWAKDISADPYSRHICALTQGNQVACWGDNGDGELGIGSTTKATKPALIKTLTKVQQISVGYNHSCALRDDGKLYCWGNRTYGQVGDGYAGSIDQTSPKLASQVPALTKVWAAYLRTCGLDKAGKLWCWGYGSNGDRGDGTTTSTGTKPVAVKGLPANIAQLDIRSRRGCAVTAGGEVYCWGNNYNRDVAPTGVSSITVATKRAAPTGVGLIGGGYYFQCASLPAKQQLQCWGDNSDGQHGIGLKTGYPYYRATPTAAKGLTVSPIAINGGDDHLVIVGTNGKVYTAGDSIDYQTGLGTTTDQTSIKLATRFSGTYVKAVGFYNTTCALDTKGEVYCLGNNFYGAVGHGSTSTSDQSFLRKVVKP